MNSQNSFLDEAEPHNEAGPHNEAEPQNEVEPKAKNDFIVVGIGASAGGVEALESLFSVMPEKRGMAVVIVQH